MRNGVRHLIGAGAGLLATPLIAAGLSYGAVERYVRMPKITVDWIAMPVFVGAFVVIGVLVGSRLSPLASLLPGLVFGGLGGASLARIGLGGDHTLWFDLVPREYHLLYAALLNNWSLPVGCVLLVASAFPSRWRGKAAARHEPPAAPPEEEAAAPEPPPLPKRIPSRY
ncbi:hypothetical protein EDD27_9187 [Nonomuraea polychroma]|uniref:Uncharacterized protein n=1 Tax=Nonomuraea polychroma TaxID=46176 RepID=A0A438MKV9_9ACTN|nr:hypothetical protein [Nonomuraea polychroma]RVX46311.1 hypothetical protein EDD27_9187 [Nonomuraea polychroma]